MEGVRSDISIQKAHTQSHGEQLLASSSPPNMPVNLSEFARCQAIANSYRHTAMLLSPGYPFKIYTQKKMDRLGVDSDWVVATSG